MRTRDWFYRRLFLAVLAGAVVGMGAGTLYIHEVSVTVAEYQDSPVDPGRPLPQFITDQYETRQR